MQRAPSGSRRDVAPVTGGLGVHPF